MVFVGTPSISSAVALLILLSHGSSVQEAATAGTPDVIVNPVVSVGSCGTSAQGTEEARTEESTIVVPVFLEVGSRASATGLVLSDGESILLQWPEDFLLGQCLSFGRCHDMVLPKELGRRTTAGLSLNGWCA